jgi:putative spermidine/putrescine transport system permease protein
MTAAALAPRGEGRRRGLLHSLSNLLYRRPGLVLLLCLTPPLLWLGVIYLGSLFALLLQAFWSIDEFSGVVKQEFTLDTFAQLFQAANFDVILRTVTMAVLVTIAAGCIAFPLAYYMARYASGRSRAFLYLLIMMPLWSSYLVRVYAWKLILAKEGVIGWAADRLGLDGALQWVLDLPVIGGSSLSTSYIGIFVVFLYIWMPFMILPIQAALERVPRSLLDASADLGARPGTTFRKVILPLALPGVAAGSIFTFSLTLGDYIIPYIFGQSKFFIGQVVYLQQGTAGNIPLAAAFTVVPIVIMSVYLWLAKKAGAFDAL